MTRHHGREARLRSEYAGLYPYLEAGKWELASVLSDRVVAHTLGRPDALFIAGERALDPVHFEFRGKQGRPRFLRTRRDDT
jgi:hypothetical protein